MKPPSDIQKQEMSLGVTDSEEAIIKGDFWQKWEGAFSDKSKKIRKILVWQGSKWWPILTECIGPEPLLSLVLICTINSQVYV